MADGTHAATGFWMVACVRGLDFFEADIVGTPKIDSKNCLNSKPVDIWVLDQQF